MIIYPNKGYFQIIPITTGDKDFVIPFFEQLYKNAQNYIDFDVLLQHELGIHRIHYLPDTETRGRTHTATILINYIDDNSYEYRTHPKIRNYNLVRQYVHDYKLDKTYDNFKFNNIIKGNLTCIYDEYKLLIDNKINNCDTLK